jgi:RHS repeat-associated protein
MKMSFVHTLMAKAVALAFSLLLGAVPLHAQYEVQTSIDYFSTSGEIPVVPAGEDVEIEFGFYNGGPSASTLRALVLQAVENAGCSDVITEIAVTYTYGNYEGKLTLTVAANTEGYREIDVTASSGSVTLTQDVQGSAVYTLTKTSPSTSTIWHGQTVNFRLSGSDDFATYQLCRTQGNITTCSDPVPGTNSALSFTDTRAGTYTAQSDYPSLVEMNGSVAVSYLAFYGYSHTFSTASYNLDPNGGTLSVPFTRNTSSSLSQLTTILSAYSSGQSSEWDGTVQVALGANGLTLTWGPNLGAAIRNCTYFVNSDGDTLTFFVPSGGEILQQDYTLTNNVITLASSQHLVSYSLLAPDGTVASTQTGNGSPLSFTVPSSPAGTWRIRASYKGQSLLLRAGIAVTSTGEVLDGGENWILRRSLRDSLGTSVMRDITYYDGLGYPVQTIQADASPTGGSLVTPVYYDNVRRDDARTYLPFVSSTGLSNVSNPFTAQQTWYTGQYNASEGAAAYAVRAYEPSALNRVTATRRPGSTYASGSHDAEVSYSTNAAGSVWKVKEGATSATLTVSGYYPAGSLHCVTAVDEDGITVQTFTDNRGCTVLERRNLPSSQTADTYYVYDGAGRVTWVVTPEGSALLTSSTSWTIDATNAANHCYRYTYDGLGRLTERRQPGRAVEYFVYDPAGRLVARQDGNLRTAGKWVLSKYNPFGEEIRQYLTGSNVFSFSGLKNAFASSANPAGVYTQVSNILLLERSYDTRPAGAPAFAPPSNSIVAPDDTATMNGGRLLYEKLADLSTIASSTVRYVLRAYYYDRQGRLRQQVETGPLSGTLRTSLRYDYVGSEDRRSVSGTLGGATSTLDRTAFFDSRSRLLRESAILGMKTAAVRHGYDVLGRHKCDTLTATGAAGIVTNTYDIHSQLLTRTAKKGSTTLFEETLRYESPTRGTAARYAGGLSEVMTQQGYSTANTYGFTYDAAGRLMTTTRFTGTSGTSGSAAYTERNLTYNRNGALLTLKRYGSSASTAQDDYSYTYSGPLLTGVSGKDDGSNINASFTHDGNGNTTADGRANLTFTYNLLNLPETVTSGNIQTVTYHWLADGTKFRVEDASGNGVIYADDLTYAVTVSGGTPTYALESAEASADGTARFLKNGTAMTPYYTIRDHIGSVRTIVNASGTVVERNDYYPFGSRTTFGTSYPTLASNRQKFSGKEDQTAVAGSTLPYLDFGARMYDAKLVRWNTYDPMAEKYYGINPYVYCNGDPVNMVDKRGLFMDNFIFEKGRYKERVPVPNEPHKLIVINNEETIEATFADPDNDPSSITNNTRVHIVSNEDISNIIKQSGAYNEDNHGLIAGIRYLKNESVANKLTGGKLDFTGSEEYYIDPDDLYITQTKGEGAIAHNGYNYGNFLWGASASALGVPLSIAKIGAHYYNFFLDPSTKWTLDSKDDQFSISVGYHWQNENK